MVGVDDEAKEGPLRKLVPGELDLRVVDVGSNDKEPGSEILLAGAPTGKIVTGSFLEGAVATARGYVLFTTNDVPAEETLAVYYLDTQLGLLDRATIVWPYASGQFTGLQLLQPNRLRFNFLRSEPWVLTLLDHRVFRIPLLSDPRGVWRLSPFRYFELASTKSRDG